MSPAERLFVLVRADLPVGGQLAQAVHAALEAATASPDGWALAVAPVAVLHVPDEQLLVELASRARDRHVPVVAVFHEPDLDGAATACAMFGAGAAGVCRDLPLAFRA